MGTDPILASPATALTPEDKVTQACARVARALGVKLTVVQDDAAGLPGAVAPGWRVSGNGSVDPNDLPAIAELVVQLVRDQDEIRALCGEVVERYEEATLVYRLSELLGSVLGESAIAILVLNEAAAVLGAVAGGVWLRGDAGLERVATFPHEDEINEPGGLDVFAAFRDGKPWSVEKMAASESAVAVPLPDTDGTPIGLLALWGRTDNRSYRAGEVKLTAAIGTLLAAFIRNDRLAAQARLTAAREREAEIAKQVHRGLLPRHEPVFRGLDIAGCCHAAENVGGDYYGYLATPDGSLGVALADVSGHGVGAAMFMAAAKGVIQAEARRLDSPGELLRRANETLVEDFSESDVFATAFFGSFQRGGRGLVYANGGHCPPLLIRADGTTEWLSPSGPALGLARKMTYHVKEHTLSTGDIVVLYTDGVIEARDPERRHYGQTRFEDIAVGSRRAGAAAIRDHILSDLRIHRDNRTPHDDATLVIVKVADSPEGAS